MGTHGHAITRREAVTELKLGIPPHLQLLDPYWRVASRYPCQERITEFVLWQEYALDLRPPDFVV